MPRDDAYGRRITDPQALRAIAHPGRFAILERLQVDGPATATECAEVAGLSPSACSYHLRLLARYGFVEEDEARSDARERVWRAVFRGWQSEIGDDVDRRESRAVDMALARVMLDSADRKALAWTDHAREEPAEWQDAALLSNSTIVVTAQELAEVTDRLMEVLRPYFATSREGEEIPEGARLVHAALRLIPRTTARPPQR